MTGFYATVRSSCVVCCFIHMIVLENRWRHCSRKIVGAPRWMKMGNIASLWRYDAAADPALQ